MRATTAAWVQDALCAQTDPEAFHPAKSTSPRLARRICNRCPVKAQCLEAAIADASLEGVWGGTTYKERQLLRRTADQGAPAAA